MSQNTSSAVMQQRREPHNSLDDFPTPPWATRALCEHVGAQGELRGLTCREPAANRGHMVRLLQEWFAAVEASDVHDYGHGYPVNDYLFGPLPEPVDWTITNPPFRLAQPFILRALESSTCGVAVIVRSAFLEGAERYRALFNASPPSLILQFSERVVIHKARLSAKGSSATAYSWVVWQIGDTTNKTHFDWIGPCRNAATVVAAVQALQSAQSTNVALAAENASLKVAQKRQAAEAWMAGEIAALRAIPADKREGLIARHMQDAGDASTIAKMYPDLNQVTPPAGVGAASGVEMALNAEQQGARIATAALAYQAAEEVKGNKVDLVTAILHVQETRK